MTKTIVVALGSENKAKIRATQLGLESIFKKNNTDNNNAVDFKVIGCSVPSGIRDQPLSDQETMQGAINRAKKALENTPEAEFGIGMEGGIHHITEPVDKWFECGWIVVVNRNNLDELGIASTARFELPKKVMHEILVNHKELAEIMDDLTNKKDIRSNEGAMGVFTNSLLHRDLIYSHALVFAFSRFTTPSSFWDDQLLSKNPTADK
ncbi:hypothetical protein CYY_000870 [Polysphondylium violaceum]|uniref:inosine/xanthosine triphosphatase n=1 Tax=Polysphondylium violaceum TaxID=133409 RepID=A0A8J4Q212_9MYCE|nr:hypothetical protein CYY_000870 [Polysphondylium violaceum]